MNTHRLTNLLSVPTQPDTLLLLPLLQSGTQPSLPAPCLHPVVTDGALAFCHASTDESCAACCRPVCPSHQSPRTIALLDAHSCPTEPSLQWLCETCAALPSRVLQLLQVLRLSLNEQLSEEQPETTALSELSAIRCHIKHHAPHLEILGVVHSEESGRPLLSVRDTAALNIVIAFGSVADLIAYLHYIPGTQTQEVCHEF